MDTLTALTPEQNRGYDQVLAPNVSATGVAPPLPLHVTVIRFGIASIWLFHGLFAKLLGQIPRQQAIVERVVGTAWSGASVKGIGLVEVLMALWMISGKRPGWCAAAMTLMLAGMNVFEIAYAMDLLLAPAWMVGANILLAGTAWYLALRVRSHARNWSPKSISEAT